MTMRAYNAWLNAMCRYSWSGVLNRESSRHSRPDFKDMNDTETNLRPRPVSESKSEMIELVLPNDTNPLGALLGGRLMHWIDLAGALAAHRHSHSYVVTASMDHIDFLVSGYVGD